MKPAYRKASQHVLLWLGVAFMGIAGQFGVLYVIYATGQSNTFHIWSLVLSLLPLLATLAFVGWRVARLNRERIKGIEAGLEPLGFLVSPSPKPETKTSFWQSMEPMAAKLGMNRGAEALQWLSLRGEAGQRMAAWEYQYVTGSGKNTQIYSFTALAWPQGHPTLPPALAALPGAQIQRLPWLERRARRKEAIELPGLEDIQKDWAVFGNAATATRMLTPDWQSLLARSPKGECWHVGDGWVCVCVRAKLDASNFLRFMDHAEELLQHLH